MGDQQQCRRICMNNDSTVVTVHWKEHTDCLLKGIWNFLKNEFLVDTNVTLNGNCIVKVHRLILSVFFSDFKQRSPTKELHEQLIDLNLDHIANHSEDVQALIEFVYTGRVNISEDRLPALKRLAETLDFQGFTDSIVNCERTSLSERDSSTDKQLSTFSQEENLNMLTVEEGTKSSIIECELKATDIDANPHPPLNDCNKDIDGIVSDADSEERDQMETKSEEGYGHASERPLKKTSTPSIRRVIKYPLSTNIVTSNDLFSTHSSKQYENKEPESNPVLEVSQTPRHRTRSQVIGTTTRTPEKEPILKNLDRSIRTRSRTAAVVAATIAAAVRKPKISEDSTLDTDEDVEDKKRQRAAYQRNYRLARKLVKCNQCNYETRDPTALKAHRSTHASADSRQISCDKCQKTFLTLQALRFHERTKCGQDRRFTCDFCGHKTLHRETWRQHLANIHKRDTRGNPLGDDIKCPQCDYVCCARHQLQLHLLRKHTVDKPFKCDHCEYAAVRRSELAKHVSIQHLKERNFMCDVCGFRSQTSNGLYSHVRSKHSGMKLYRCDLCGKEYNCHTSFKVHKQKHTGDVKLYVCHVCGHSCNKRTNLRSHMRRIHSLELESLKKNYAPRVQNADASINREPSASDEIDVSSNANFSCLPTLTNDHDQLKQEMTTAFVTESVASIEPVRGFSEVHRSDDINNDDDSLSGAIIQNVEVALLESVFNHVNEPGPSLES